MDGDERNPRTYVVEAGDDGEVRLTSGSSTEIRRVVGREVTFVAVEVDVPGFDRSRCSFDKPFTVVPSEWTLGATFESGPVRCEQHRGGSSFSLEVRGDGEVTGHELVTFDSRPLWCLTVQRLEIRVGAESSGRSDFERRTEADELFCPELGMALRSTIDEVSSTGDGETRLPTFVRELVAVPA